jgi:hypothetical protein
MIEHVPEVSNGFLSDDYHAYCSCGWMDSQTYDTSDDARRAALGHADAVAAAYRNLRGGTVADGDAWTP